MSSHSIAARNALAVMAGVCIALFVCTTSQAASRTTTHIRHYPRTGRVIVQRSADFGTELFLRLWIDGQVVDAVAWNYRYDRLVPAGRHVLTVQAVPKPGVRDPASIAVTIEPGRTYVFTGMWESDRAVLRVTDSW